MRYGLVVLVLCGLALGYTQSSFRAQSTAGLWTDDYDLLFEPARIPLISGSRVWTGLSNLVSGQEEQLGTRTENFYLVGGSANLTKPFYPGLLFDRFCDKSPLFTGLVGRNDDSLFGEGKLVQTELRDLDSNGTYDYKREDVTSAQAWEDDLSTDYYVGFGLKFDSLRLGAAYARNDFTQRGVDPALNRFYERSDSNLVDGSLTFLERDSATGEARQSSVWNRLMLNAWYDMSPLRVGVLASFTPTSQSISHDNRSTGLIDRSPANPAIGDYVHTGIVDTGDIPYQGNIMGATLSVFYVPNAQVESRFYLSAASQSQTVSDDAVGFETFTADSVTHPGVDTACDTSFHRYRGRTSGQGIGLSTRQLFTVSDRLKLGLGLGFATSSWEDSLVDTSAARSYYAHNNGDTIAGSEDLRMVTTSSEEWLNRTTGSGKVLSLPVGLEFKVVPSVALRLGVDSRITWRDETRIEKLVASAPEHTRVDYGDGWFYESVGDAQQDPGKSETSRTTTHSTQFSYGIGYNPIDNLQIDLMGFAKLTDLNNWRLSVTLKF
jgi:hypothetical protein